MQGTTDHMHMHMSTRHVKVARVRNVLVRAYVVVSPAPTSTNSAFKGAGRRRGYRLYSGLPTPSCPHIPSPNTNTSPLSVVETNTEEGEPAPTHDANSTDAARTCQRDGVVVPSRHTHEAGPINGVDRVRNAHVGSVSKPQATVSAHAPRQQLHVRHSLDGRRLDVQNAC